MTADVESVHVMLAHPYTQLPSAEYSTRNVLSVQNRPRV